MSDSMSIRPSLADVEPLPWNEPGILVGVDGSALAEAALAYGADLAPKLGLPLHAMAVWDHSPYVYGEWYYAEPSNGAEHNAERICADAAESVFSGTAPDWFSSSVQRGRPAPTLIAHSRQAVMLIVGSRGHGGFAGLLLGSVSAACAAHARCPVLVYHGSGDPSGGRSRRSESVRATT